MRCRGGGLIGKWNALIWTLCNFPFVLLSCPQKVINGNFGQGCKGNVDLEEVEWKLLKAGSLA